MIYDGEKVDFVLRNVRRDLRLSMNGVAAASMKEKGVAYRMNFGVSIPHLIRIASEYEPDRFLAERMWQEDVRELKILATMLCPIAEFSTDDAFRWVRDVKNQEIREQLCKNLLQNLSFAGGLIKELVLDQDEQIRTTAYWLFARLCIIRSPQVEEVPLEWLMSIIRDDLMSESFLMRQAAMNAMKFSGRISLEYKEMILNMIINYKNSDDQIEREIFDVISFEFGL